MRAFVIPACVGAMFLAAFPALARGAGMASRVLPPERPGAALGKADAAPVTLKHEVWGRTYYGEGYVYGPTLWRSSLAIVDIDGDSDNDIVFKPHYSEPTQLIRNLGASGAFYPGGLKDLLIPDPSADLILDVVMDFDDVTGDGRPDLVAVANTFDPDRTSVVWYANNGSGFTYQATVYTSPQLNTLPEIAVNLADINGDGLLDLFIMEPFLNAPERQHRVFLMLNRGTAAAPQWAAPTEITELSALLPPPMDASAAKAGGPNTGSHDPRTRPARTGAKAGRLVRVSDIEVVDWNVDGLLDFLFYDAEQGVDWVRNVGTATAPAWAASLNDTMRPPWRHTDIEAYGIPLDHHDNLDVVFGSFAVRTNPGALLPDAKWLDDFYIVMDGWLITRRYFTQDQSYRLIQENAIEYATGQGPPAFWDYDGDGDLDMFRTGIGSTRLSHVLLFPNVGTPYSPAWGKMDVIGDITLDIGSAANAYRQELYGFGDLDGDGATEFAVQRQDGTLDVYWARPPDTPGAPPTFPLLQNDMGEVVGADQTGVEPRGVAVANFDLSADGAAEVITAYYSEQGGAVIYYDPAWDYYQNLTEGEVFEDDAGDPLDPILVESLSAADLDLDGRPDLVITISWDVAYRECLHMLYRNTAAQAGFRFDLVGILQGPSQNPYSRTIGFADIDADGDADLFAGHQIYNAASDRVRHYLQFHRNAGDTGLDYWRTRAVSGQEWPLQWNGVQPNYTYVLNASGGHIENPGWYTAGPAAPVVDILQSTGLDPDVRVFVDVLPPVAPGESKAILVAGGDPADSLNETFETLAAYAYWVLRSEGLAKESIRLYASSSDLDADGDGFDDVYAAPSLGSLEASVTQWARGAQRVLVYLLDHGQRDRFHVNSTQYLESATYAQWLETLRGAGPGPQVTTIIDTCEAGSFIDNLAVAKDAQKSGAERITITSSGIGAIGGIALFDKRRYLSFSLSFWDEVFNGATYGQAFESAKVSINSINPLQMPQIDDDGDGIPNESNDGLLAASARPGADFALPGTGVFIGEVAPLQVISTNTATLWLSGVVANLPVEGAGALVVPPNFQRPALGGDDEQPVTGLDWVDFTYSAERKRWEASCAGFTQGGLFRVQYYVSIAGRYHASPRIGFVDRIGKPDAWEADNTFATARWLPINSVQGHNFHASGDVDWLRFTSPAGEPATLAVISPAYRCQPVVGLYRLADLEANPAAAPLREVPARAPGKSVVFEQTFAASDQYLLRIANTTPGQFGEGTSYMVLVAVGTGGNENLVPSTLVVTVSERGTGTLLEGANVRFAQTVNCRTDGLGIAQFLCPAYGSYLIETTLSGYANASRTVEVNNLFETVDVGLAKEGDGNGGSCAGGTLAGAGGGPSGNGPGGDGLLIGLACAVLACTGWMRRRAVLT